jgi:seryl-tRNA synthetase
VPLTNFVRDEILPPIELPIKLVAHTPCFRSEAGSYGRDTRGMIRQHQFDKVEWCRSCTPTKATTRWKSSPATPKPCCKSSACPTAVALCTGDMGFSAAKTYDLEVWLPAQNTYREILLFQLRGLPGAPHAGALPQERRQGKTELVHTLNGSGLAVGRTLVAVLENYQKADGSVTVPAFAPEPTMQIARNTMERRAWPSVGCILVFRAYHRF